MHITSLAATANIINFISQSKDDRKGRDSFYFSDVSSVLVDLLLLQIAVPVHIQGDKGGLDRGQVTQRAVRVHVVSADQIIH